MTATAFALLAVLLGPPPASAPTAPASAPAAKAVVAVLPFAIDFKDDSSTDEDYGQRVAIAIAAKLATLKGWEVIDRFGVQGTMAAMKLPRGDQPDQAKLAGLARLLAADVVVYGSASGAGAAKRIHAAVVDFRHADEHGGRMLLDKTYKLAYWTDLRFVLEDAVSAVTGQSFAHPSEELAILDPASLEAWKRNPNLIANPFFADGKEGRLGRWEAVIAAHRYNPPWTDQPTATVPEDQARMVLWSPAHIATASERAGNGGKKATVTHPTEKVLQFAMPDSVAGSYGLACYSDWIEVSPGHRYRCSITYASQGPTFLPFIKGYALINTPGEAQPQRREVYRRQFPKLKSTGGQWQTARVDFVPSVLPPRQAEPSTTRSGASQSSRREPYDLKWIRLDLYCYWPAGHVWVKEAAVKLVESPGADGKVIDPMTPAAARYRP
jgi:TolB-like protein